MTKEQENKLKKLMKKWPTLVNNCINNLYVKQGIRELKRLVEEIIKCIKEKEGSGTDYSTIKKEIGRFKDEMIEVQDIEENEEQEIKKIPHKKPPTR